MQLIPQNLTPQLKKDCQDGLRYSVDRSDTIDPEGISKAAGESEEIIIILMQTES